jgi:DNA polymerase
MESPDFEILLLSYAFDNEPVKCVDIASGEEIPAELVYALMDTETVKHAWNAAFEYTAFMKFFNGIDTSQWVDDMVVSLYHGFPASLGDAGKALGLPQDKQKDARGKRLIRLFSVPDKKKGRIMPKDKPEEWAEYKEYNIRDVETEREISNRVCGYGAFPVPDFLWNEWRIDRRINDTGVRLDMDLVRGALAISEEETTALKNRVKDITGTDNPNSVAQLKSWIEEKTGTAPESIDKAAVSELLSGELPEEVREVLEIRQKLGKSSIAKYSAMVDCECADSRARGLFQFYGASHTGRWAGRSIQLQNLPRNYIESIGYARELVKAEDRDSIELMYGDVQDTLSQLLRTALIPSDGCEFVIADYSAIECRVLAWLAGEESTLDAFRNGEDIYCHTASRMYGVPVVKHGENGELRQKGKQATLACGYGGGVNALRAMGAKGTDSELQPLVDYWRRANPNVVKYWAELERAAKFAMRTGETAYAKHVAFRYETDDKSGLRFLTLELPSGRKLFYSNPRFKTNRFGGTSIAYDTQRTAGWGETETYSGKICENVVQGVARDLLMNALKNIEAAGYTVVSHVHDEVIVDANKGSLTVDALSALMCKLPSWADTSLPLEAAGFTSEYYMKD